MNLKEKKGNYITVDSTINAFLKDTSQYKVLSPSEEAELIDKMLAGDEEAKNMLIACNQRFVYSVAKWYGNDSNILDLVEEGNKGLITALETYDKAKSKGKRFLSYAIWYIKREIQAYLNGENLLIRKTNNTKTVYKLNKIKQKFYAEHNRYPDVDEIAEILETEYGLKIKEKEDLLDITTTSINTCFDDEDSRAFENTPFFTERTAIENEYLDEMDKEFNSVVSGALMSVLTEREQTIIKMAFGIGYNKEYTNPEIGEELGMTGERVRQLKNGAIKKMQDVAVSKRLSF